MQVQIVCRSDKHPTLQNAILLPFEYEGSEFDKDRVILVPDIESYHEVRGSLTLQNMEGKVVCLPPPSEYKPPVGLVPYALIHPDYVAKCDPIGETKPGEIANLTYYFEKKDAATTNQVHE